MVGSFIDAKELIRDKIREKIGTAAFLICSSGGFFMDDIVGILALLANLAGNFFFSKQSNSM